MIIVEINPLMNASWLNMFDELLTSKAPNIIWIAGLEYSNSVKFRLLIADFRSESINHSLFQLFSSVSIIV